jgi:hypothetical protein
MPRNKAVKAAGGAAQRGSQGERSVVPVVGGNIEGVRAPVGLASQDISWHSGRRNRGSFLVGLKVFPFEEGFDSLPLFQAHHGEACGDLAGVEGIIA